MAFVTSIVSTYNSERFIEGKILDLINQSICNKLEIIIINSGSEENEESIISPYLLKFKNIKYIRTEKRETIYKAWNRALKLATGKYITNSNTDDRLRTDALEILSNILEEDDEIGMVYGDQYITSVENQPFNLSYKEGVFRRLNFSRILLLSEYLPGSQSMWRNDIHTKHNIYFNGKYEVAGDYEFALKVAELYKIKRIDAVLGSYYRSLQNHNKELQNITLTEQETKEIQFIYLQRYIKSLSKVKQQNLWKKTTIIKKIPSPIFSAFRLFSELLNSRNLTPPKLFWMKIRKLLQEQLR